MTISWECNHHDVCGYENEIDRFEVTTTRGVLISVLFAAEKAKINNLWNIHLYTHPGHSYTAIFSIPEGYVQKGNMIFRAE